MIKTNKQTKKHSWSWYKKVNEERWSLTASDEVGPKEERADREVKTRFRETDSRLLSKRQRSVSESLWVPEFEMLTASLSETPNLHSGGRITKKCPYCSLCQQASFGLLVTKNNGQYIKYSETVLTNVFPKCV